MIKLVFIEQLLKNDNLFKTCFESILFDKNSTENKILFLSKLTRKTALKGPISHLRQLQFIFARELCFSDIVNYLLIELFG